MNQNQIEFIPENRKFKTLSGIPKESKKFKVLQKYIEIEGILFQKQSTTEENAFSIFNEIKLILERNGNDENLLSYLIKLLNYFILIRPKQAIISCNLLSALISNYGDKRDFIINTIKSDENYKSHLFIQDVLYSQKIVEDRPKDFIYRQETVLSLYKEGSLEFILKEDNVNQLKEYIGRNQNISKIEFLNDSSSPFFIIKKSHSNIEIDLLDFCSFYGSFECFKFLRINNFKFGNYIREMSIFGGNFNIIHEVVENNISFDYCYEYYIKYHQRSLNEWSLSNYKCEIFPSTKCVEYYDYYSFLFFLFNEFDDIHFEYFIRNQGFGLGFIDTIIDLGADINKEFKELYFIEKITPLSYLFTRKVLNIELIKLLVQRGADINKGEKTPLYYLCYQRDINIEAIKLLIELGADVNIGENRSDSIRTPLACLCKRDDVNLEAVKLLIENGADVNKSDVSFWEFITPLAFLCIEENVNIGAIKLLIDNGADPNEGRKSENNESDMCTPLGFLCKQRDINFEAIKALIQLGADVNKMFYGGIANKIKYTPLGYLCQHKNINFEAIKFLIENNADINKECKEINDYITPLGYLCHQNKISVEFIKYFINNHADVNKGTVTPLFYLCKHKEINNELIKLLLENGADVNKELQFSIFIFTPLSYLIHQQRSVNIEAIKMLIEHGADVNNGNYTPLCWLCQQKPVNVEAIKLLIENGADVNKGENPPLEYLCKSNEVNIKVIKFFLDKGAQINEKILSLVKTKGNQELLSLFSLEKTN